MSEHEGTREDRGKVEPGEAQEAENPYLALQGNLFTMSQDVGRMSVAQDPALEGVLAAARSNVMAMGGDAREIDVDALARALQIVQGAAGGLAQQNAEAPAGPDTPQGAQ